MTAQEEMRVPEKSPLEQLRDKESRLWHRLELFLTRHAMKVAQRPAVDGAMNFSIL